MRSSKHAVLPVALLSLALAACGGNKNEKFDYNTPGADASKRPSLTVPPDLIAPTRENRFDLPAANTASGVAAAQQGAAKSAPAAPASKFRIERFGNQRWLVAPLSAEQVWPKLQAFWKDLGFILVKDDLAVGIMETEWAENRAKIAGDPFRRVLGTILGSLVSNGERDRYRTRIEPSAQPGMLEIYVSHRGAEEMNEGTPDSVSYWELRPANPELEAEMLQRIAVRLGQDEKQAEQMVAESKAAPVVLRSTLVMVDGEQQLELDEAMDRGWRQIGLALDRIGVVVEDRDRAKSTYFVRYVAGSDLDGSGKKDTGWFSGWFGSKKPSGTDQYRVLVSEQGKKVRVRLLDKDGQKASPEAVRQILNLLQSELK